MSDYDPLLHERERRDRESRQRVRELILEQGRPDVLAAYNKAMRELDLGITMARSAWHSITAAQRRVLEVMEPGRVLMRTSWSASRYMAIGSPHAISNVCGVATIRNLERRELVAWDGGIPDPERKAVITERGLFTLKHGRDACP